MFERFTRSLNLVRASASVLAQDTHLLVFPLCSGVAFLMVAACFLLPLFGLGGFDALEQGEVGRAPVYAFAFAFYVVQYVVIFYFNTALVGATMIRLDGGVPTIGDGLRVANARFGTILGYAVIAATVGMVLRMIQERVGFVGKWIAGLLGAGWTVATALVVPVLVARDVGPVEAVRDSAVLLKRTWGENVIGNVGMGLAFTVLHLALGLGGVALILGAAYLHSMVLVALLVAALVILILGSVLVHAALGGIYSAALYRYAVHGEAAGGFGNAALQSAFRSK
ncbi:MAG: DUF6159 family protein [Pseudomonadota bacterium]